MKIAIVGANGRLGSIVSKLAIERGLAVKGFIRSEKAIVPKLETVRKSLFDMRKEDIADCSVMISAYGSGFYSDPILNLQAFQKYIELNEGTERHLIAIAGAGSLFTDETHTKYCYQTDDYPDFLRDISLNIKLGIDELKKTTNLNWTAVCPSSVFDPDGDYTGKYIIGADEHLLVSKDGTSRVTYYDLADAMLKIALENTYQQQQITVLTI